MQCQASGNGRYPSWFKNYPRGEKSSQESIPKFIKDTIDWFESLRE